MIAFFQNVHGLHKNTNKKENKGEHEMNIIII